MILYLILGLVIAIATISVSKKKPTDHLFGNPIEHLGLFNKGFCINGSLSALTREQSYRNVLVIGNTGSGKTSAVLLPSLFTTARGKSSGVILDVSSEIFKATSGYLSKVKKRKIYCFDLTDSSDSFNPLTLCRSVSDIDKVAHTLIRNSGVDSKSDPYWSAAAEQCISMFMQLSYYYENDENKNMTRVTDLLESYMADVDAIDRKFINTNDRLLKTYKSFNAIPEKQRLSVVSTAMTALKIFKNPDVQRCTMSNSWSIESFRVECSLLYLCIPLPLINFIAPLLAVIFEMSFQQVLSRIPQRSENPIWFFIDEMMVMKLDLGLVFSNCRKYRVGCMGVLQEERMLAMKYSQGEIFAIKANSCCRLYLPGQNIESARELQELIGKCLIVDENGNERYSYGMEAAQIRTFDRAIVLINSALPLRLKVTPFFRHLVYYPRTKFPPYESANESTCKQQPT